MIVLYGAGTIGGKIARELKAKGETDIVFADNDLDKGQVEGISVWSPQVCRELYPDATWVASVHDPRVSGEIRRHIAEMGVKSVSVYEFTPWVMGVPPKEAVRTILPLLGDHQSHKFFLDQIEFREHKDISKQCKPDDIRNVYFEDFYTRLDNEHYVDCGAFDGDMVREFHKRWSGYQWITAFEPDPKNFENLGQWPLMEAYPIAISDHSYFADFSADADQTSHIGEGNIRVRCDKLDALKFPMPPTLIKMDIEGYEKEGLWGARNIIKEHSPVLAICAYHKGPDFWEIPLLINALNPSYKLHFRRYIEGSLEIIWYAVPPERVP